MSPWWLIVFLAIFLIGVTKSGFGSGVGLMIVPMTISAFDHIPALKASAALGVLLPLLIAGDLISVWQYRRLFSLAIVRRLLPGTLLGVAIGASVLWWFHRGHAGDPKVVAALIKLEVGFESVVLVGLHWWRVSRGQGMHVAPSIGRNALVGAAAGASSTLAHAAGPIIALYLLPQKLDRQLYVGTCAIYFFMLNTVKLPPYFLTRMFTSDSLALSGKCLPLVIAGAAFGFWLTRRLHDQLFSKIVYLVTFCLGWYLLADATRTLLR